MDEESTSSDADETEETSEDTFQDEARNGRGPGFRLGLLLGIAAGAAAATLFAPSSGEDQRQRMGEESLGGEDTSPDKMRAVLDRVRARVQEAASEARQAAELAEEQGRARYQELTGENE